MTVPQPPKDHEHPHVVSADGVERPLTPNDTSPPSARRGRTLNLFIVFGIGLLALGIGMWIGFASIYSTLDSRAAKRDVQRQADIARISADEKKQEATNKKASDAAELAKKSAASVQAADCFLVVALNRPDLPATAKVQLKQFAALAGCPVPK